MSRINQAESREGNPSLPLSGLMDGFGNLKAQYEQNCDEIFLTELLNFLNDLELSMDETPEIREGDQKQLEAIEAFLDELRAETSQLTNMDGSDYKMSTLIKIGTMVVRINNAIINKGIEEHRRREHELLRDQD